MVQAQGMVASARVGDAKGGNGDQASGYIEMTAQEKGVCEWRSQCAIKIYQIGTNNCCSGPIYHLSPTLAQPLVRPATQPSLPKPSLFQPLTLAQPFSRLLSRPDLSLMSVSQPFADKVFNRASGPSNAPFGNGSMASGRSVYHYHEDNWAGHCRVLFSLVKERLRSGTTIRLPGKLTVMLNDGRGSPILLGRQVRPLVPILSARRDANSSIPVPVET